MELVKMRCTIRFQTYLEGEWLVVVGVTEVSIVEEPNVSDIDDLVVWASEELSEVLAGLEQVSQPDHSGKVTVSALQELSSQLHFICLLLVGGLYNHNGVNQSV